MATIDDITPGSFWMDRDRPLGLDTIVQVGKVGEVSGFRGECVTFAWCDFDDGGWGFRTPDEFLRDFQLLVVRPAGEAA